MHAMFLAGQALVSVERGHSTVRPGTAFLGRWHLHVGAKKGSCGYLQEAQLGGEGTTDALALSRRRAFKKQREG